MKRVVPFIAWPAVALVVSAALALAPWAHDAPRAYSQPLPPGPAATPMAAPDAAASGQASAGGPQYVQGQGATQQPTLTPEQLQQAQDAMRRANPAGPQTPVDPTAPQQQGVPSVPETWPAPLGPPLAPSDPAVFPVPSGSLIPPALSPGPHFLAGGWGPGPPGPPAPAGERCTQNLQGDWQVAGRQTSPSATDYTARISVSQRDAWLLVAQPADHLTYYGICRGDWLLLDVYAGNQFTGSESGSVEREGVRIWWAGVTGAGLETWGR